MKGQTVLTGIVSLLVFAGSSAPVAAHDDDYSQPVAVPISCLEPLKPIVAEFFEAGSEDELRQEFELYFNEAEAYLNCLNAESSRVRAEAQQAAYEFDDVLNRVPPSEQDRREQVVREPMVTSGTLNLDYRGVGG